MTSTATRSPAAEDDAPVELPADRPRGRGRGPVGEVRRPAPAGPADQVLPALAVLLARYSGLRTVTVGLAGASGASGAVRIDVDPRLPLADLPVTRVPAAGVPVWFGGRLAELPGAELAVRTDRAGLLAEYDRALFDADRIERLADHLVRLLDRPGTPTGELELMDPAERALVVEGANATTRPYERRATVHGLFAAQAARTPDATAVVDGDRTLTYRELDDWASTLACALPLAPGEPVGLLLPRSAELLAGMLAILKAGGAYVPIEADYPAERISLVLADCGARVVVTDRDLDVAGTVVRPGDTGTSVPAPVDPTDPAYLIYTSGTTGRPKGVQVPHRGVVRLVRNTDYVPLGPDTRILPTCATVFDVATFEVWGALLNGGSLHLVDTATVLDAARLGKALRDHRVTTLWLTAPLFNQVVEQDPTVFRPLSHLLVGGDALSARHVGAVLSACPEVALINGYGPTENTTFSTTHRVRPRDLDRIPIGRPIANSTAYVLDPRMRPCPVGVVGELWLGGDGVATGYRGRPEATAAAFVPDPFRPGGTLYRSGDLASRRPDGVLDFHGRRDAQVKVRGFRIELGEVETALLDQPGVRAAVVLAVDRPGGADKYLCGWYVGPAEPAAVRAGLAARLPGHLLPAFLVPVPAIPLNRSGKVDRAALPAPDPGTEHVPPRTEAERTLVGIVERTLGVTGVGVRHRLTDLGADSLAVSLLATRVEQALGVRVPLAELRGATVEELAARSGGPAATLPAAPDRPGHPLSPQQHRLFVEQLKDETATHYNVPFTVELPAGTEPGRLAAALRALVDRHESLRTSFDLADGRPLQRVHASVELPVGTGPVPVRPFDLAVPPLCRAGIETRPDAVLLHLDVHHTVVDGVSVGMLVEDLLDLYAGTAPAPAGARYRDYAEWAATPAAAAERAAQEPYWREVFGRPHARAELPLDDRRPPIRSLAGGALEFGLGAERTARIRAAGPGPYVVLTAAYAALLGELTGDPDVVLGTPVAGRRQPGTDRTVGMFANTVCLRVDASPGRSWGDLLAAVGAAVDGAVAHQDLPLERIAGSTRDYRRSPVFDALVAVHSRRYTCPAGVPVRLGWNGRAVFDLNLQVYDEPAGLRASWQYAAALFRPDTVARFRDRLLDLLDAALADPAAPLGGAPTPTGVGPALDFDF